MEAKVTKIYKSEYGGYFTIELEVSGNRFTSITVFSKSQIRNFYNVSEEEFEQLKK